MKTLLYFAFFFFILFTAFNCKKDPAITTKNTSSPNITIVADNLEVAWGMAFLPNGDFLFCERKGKIGLIKKDETDRKVLMVRNVQASEGGLLGLAIDPNFNTSHFIFIYETIPGSNRVVRLKYENDVLSQDAVILTGIPAANNHDGGALKFGPDGFLYLGTGDAVQPNLAQDTSSLAGKILRMDRDGNPVTGNPFNNLVWTLGHRNVQGFDWSPEGKMLATEHGPSGEFGWCCHDELNLIEPGKNYGWPIYLAGTEVTPYTPPVYQTDSEIWAPSGCTFIKGKEWGQWEGDFIFGCLRGQRLVHFDIDPSGSSVRNRQDTLVGTYQRLRNIIQAPDGSLYFSSSNVGTSTPPPLKNDDKIYRLSVQ